MNVIFLPFVHQYRQATSKRSRISGLGWQVCCTHASITSSSYCRETAKRNPSTAVRAGPRGYMPGERAIPCGHTNQQSMRRPRAQPPPRLARRSLNNAINYRIVYGSALPLPVMVRRRGWMYRGMNVVLSIYVCRATRRWQKKKCHPVYCCSL